MQGLLRCMMRQGEFTSAQMHVDGLQMKRLPKIFTLSFLPEAKSTRYKGREYFPSSACVHML